MQLIRDLLPEKVALLYASFGGIEELNQDVHTFLQVWQHSVVAPFSQKKIQLLISSHCLTANSFEAWAVEWLLNHAIPFVVVRSTHVYRRTLWLQKPHYYAILTFKYLFAYCLHWWRPKSTLCLEEQTFVEQLLYVSRVDHPAVQKGIKAIYRTIKNDIRFKLLLKRSTS